MKALRQSVSVCGLVVLWNCSSAWVSFGQSPARPARPPAEIKTNPAPVQAKSNEEYRQFAMRREGDDARGKELFANDQTLACFKCHAVDGKGGKAGPDLFAVGDKFGRSEIIESVLSPSATIAVGYSTTTVETKSGEEYQGIIKQVTDAWIELMGADAQPVRVATLDILERRTSEVSLMPEGLHAGLTPQGFADLVEYLVSLKQPESAELIHHGMPSVIPHVVKPIALRPFHSEELKFDHPVWIGQLPGVPDAFLVVEHETGKIWRLEKGSARSPRADSGASPDSVVSKPAPAGKPDESGFRRATENRTPAAHAVQFPVGGPATGTGTLSAGVQESPALLIPGTNADTKTMVVDLEPCLQGTRGLLGLALHPNFPANRKYYFAKHLVQNGQFATIIFEREAAPDFKTDSGQPSRLLLKLDEATNVHYGGGLQFGPDGCFYIGMGDSGPQEDPQGHGQDTKLFLGKMLRINVDHCEGDKPYAVPRDNPFVDRPDFRSEIWAYGFREPWRFSFDPITGDLWVGDVGQDRYEEVGIVRRGENHGWNVYEGFERFSNRYRKAGATYVPPVFAYGRKHGPSVTGGYVYRANPRSLFYGVYIFGDYESRRIWGLAQENRVLKKIRQIGTAPQRIVSFGQDERGELYLVGYEGMIYKMDFDQAVFE